MKVLIIILSVLLSSQVIDAHIYIVSGEPNRFIWLPSTKNRKVFKISNEEQKFGNENIKDELDMEKDHQALQNLFDANNNDRMIK